jgi:CBS domain-containing protein
MVLEETVEFLRNVPPFQFLDEAVLRKVAVSASLEFYPRGEVVLSQDGPASDSLRIIKKGGVKVHVNAAGGEEVLIDYRGEGDAFGFLSLVSGDKSRASVTAVEDTICYLIPRKTITSILDVNPAFTEFFVKSFLSKYIDKTFQEMEGRSLLYGGGDKLLFTTPVGELATKGVRTGQQDMSIKEAAEEMSRWKISSLVIVDNAGVPVGIVTDRDLREKVVARSRSVADPVSGIMSVSLIKVDARDYCFEALLRMIHYNIHHLLVVDEGRLKGVVTNHDLMLLQGTSPASLAKEIEGQQTVEDLVPAAKKTNKMIALLLKEGAKASNITRCISEINDRLVRKIMEITERKCGPPPVPFCWIVYGSEGRKEQTFKTDQDNAIIYRDPATEAEERSAAGYFERFAALANESLVKCGFPPCTGGYMASNPKWRRPLAAWKEYFSSWIYAPVSDAVLFSVILFDFRPVYGDLSLGETLRSHLMATVKEQGIFLKFLANMAVALRPPLGFFKTFVVEKSGEHKNELNLKTRVIAPLIDIVRLLSLEQGVEETSTLERLDVLRERHSLVAEFGQEIEHAFEFVSLLRIHHQYGCIEAGAEPDNFVDPDRLTNLEKKTLKEACQLISRLQDALAKEYNPGTVM